MKNCYFILWLFLNLELNIFQFIFWTFFAEQVSAENEVSFHAFVVRRAWLNVTSEREYRQNRCCCRSW